ncbi:MAG: NlpC/P60 family protein [Rhabdochlamydiaceae bacterium]|nr:NlpC/P60 family protein [Candidatus Amphrikana amoebophyrae]
MESYYSEKGVPLFNTSQFYSLMLEKGVGCDKHGHFRALETILLPHQPFQIVKYMDHNIIEVKSDHYDYDIQLFTDIRFSSKKRINPPPLTSITQVLDLLKKQVGRRYLWGGTVNSPINQMLKLYPPRFELNNYKKQQWILNGIDCSGLLHFATSGFTPRNSSKLRTYGIEIDEGNLKPLDLILEPNHVMIVIDNKKVIQSKENRGVFIEDLSVRLSYSKNRNYEYRRFTHLFDYDSTYLQKS